ncbi:MAG: 3,4-dihydroxy-2-butanone-4-phosphate synthase [Betaproteobacteria bacterium]|nr:3,4-dihydroxy-2-butanone-4-phosphate synthase [Betaproteobacteria bacterium]
MTVASTQDIIEDIRNGRMVVLVDEEDRENEGDLVMAADFVTPEAINFMATHGRGLICMPITESRARALNLPPMVTDNRTPHGTAFTVSIEAATGVTTGISAADRARTIRVATARNAKADDIVQPGHIFPLISKPGGVLVRAGHTEAATDLAELAGLTPAGVICEILNEDGSMARLPDLIPFAEKHGIKVGTIADLVRHRSVTETLVERVSEKTITTPYGPFRLIAFHDKISDEVHLALARGEIKPDVPALVRVHEPFSSLDLFDFDNGRHAYSVAEAMRIIAAEGSGVIVLMRRHETAADVLSRLAPQDERERRAQKWDPRTHGIGAQILRELNVRKMRVLAWPKRIPSMAGFDLEAVEYLPPDSMKKLRAI